MKFVGNILTLFILFFSITQTILAQNIPYSEDQLRLELKNRELEEDVVREALAANGFDLDSILNASPAELLTIQSIIENLEKEDKKAEVNLLNKTAKPEQNPSKSGPVFSETEKIDTTIEEELIAAPLPIFGHQYIDVESYKSSETINVNESYILGSGDIIAVSIWSENAQFDKSFIVNKSGYIRLLDAKQRIFVRGMRLADARNKIKARFLKHYRFNAGDFSMTLESARKINISIFGEIKNPGAYSFTATHNVLDALRYTGGLTENASVRNIKIISGSGKILKFDLYKYLTDPSFINDFYMQDGDIILVPITQNVVELQGAVQRNFRFEILKGEGITDLIKYAGGFSKDANKNLVQIERFTADKKSIIDINYTVLSNSQSDFLLENGDIITVRSIAQEAKNFVVVEGEVVNEGRYERVDNMRVSALLTRAKLKPESKTDFAYLMRRQMDGTSTYLRLNLDEILENIGKVQDLLLQNQDTLTIWSKQRFIDNGTISVEGAIRFPGTYNYDFSEKMFFSDALIMAGGVSRDASNIAFIHRADPLQPNVKQYIRINLDRLDTDKAFHESIVLEPFDRIEILSKNLFTERTSVKISGPVNNPGEFQYGKNMTLRDLVILAGGFQLAASTRNIEISRVLIRENKPTTITIAKVNFNRDYNNKDDENVFLLEPYDHVKVRYVPEFEFQRDVEIIGEVRYPGIYTLATKNEKISKLIQNAGGLTEEAFIDGATLYRQEDSLGYIVLKLREALDEVDSRYNFILKNGDIIEIPKMKDFVSIKGATKAYEMYSEKMVKNPHGLNVPYHKSKNAGYYIKKYAGGFADNANKKAIFVEHANGEIEKTKSFLFFRMYPEVRKGSVIKVGKKTKKNIEEKKQEKEIDWSKVISDSLAQAMTIFTLILLAKQASN